VTVARADVVNLAGEVVGQVDLDDTVFGIRPNVAVVHQAVVCQLANARRGTADTKTRGEISASGSKLWRQKGTGRARQGSRRAPHWRGGGVAFGPHPRSYAQSLPRKMRRLALRSALSAKVAEENLIVLDKLEVEAPRTKEMVNILRTLGVDGKAMIVLAERNEAVQRSVRNIPGVLSVTPGSMNLLDLLNHDRLVMTVDAVSAVTQWLRTERAALGAEPRTNEPEAGSNVE